VIGPSRRRYCGWANAQTAIDHEKHSEHPCRRKDKVSRANFIRSVKVGSSGGPYGIVDVRQVIISVPPDIVSQESTCASLPRWVLEFAFQVGISLKSGPFSKLNRPNRIRLCGFKKMIFPVWTRKSVQNTFVMDDGERVIIKFRENKGADACQIAAILQAQFAEYDYQFQIVQFWIAETRRCRQDLHDEIRSGTSPLDDLDDKNLAIIDKSPFEPALSIAKRVLVAYLTGLQHLHESFGFKSFHLHWVPHLLTGDLPEK
jgi:hypothetical protein